MDAFSVTNAVIVMNWNFKTPRTHRMPRWVRATFIEFLPRILFMQRPVRTSPLVIPLTTPDIERRALHGGRPHELDLSDIHHPTCPYGRMSAQQRSRAAEAVESHVTPEMNKAIEAVRFISAHLKNEDDFQEVIDDWRYVSLVMDRVLFFTHMIVMVITTCTILIRTPLLDTFSQADFKEANRIERLCRDTSTKYNETCFGWYPVVCLDELGNPRNDLEALGFTACSLWLESRKGTM
jgi:nicotinic acetylcholine receptor